MLRSFFLVLLLVFACAELLVFISVADLIGPGETVLLQALVSFAGILLLKRTGRRGLEAMRASAKGESGEIAMEDALTGLFRFLAALLLILPGFLSDVLAALLLMPVLRNLATRPVRGWFARHTLKPDADTPRAGSGFGGRKTTRSVIIEGEATEIEPNPPALPSGQTLDDK